jgi:hypothetical protein
VIEWGGRLFSTSGEFRSYMTGSGVSWATFLGKHPAAAVQMALPYVDWEGNRFYDQASLLRLLSTRGISYRRWAELHPEAAAILAGKPVAGAQRTVAQVLEKPVAIGWDGVGFTSASGLRTYLAHRDIDWESFLARHPVVVQTFKLASVIMDGVTIYTRGALSHWLEAHQGNLAAWTQKHPGAAEKLMA